MLDEIGRMLSLALERKELKERLIKKQSEEADFNKRLEELQNEIDEAHAASSRSRDKKLSLVNSYLDRSRGAGRSRRRRSRRCSRRFPTRSCSSTSTARWS